MWIQGVFVGRAGFEKKHAVAAGFRQAARDDAAGGPGAGDDEIVSVRIGTHGVVSL